MTLIDDTPWESLSEEDKQFINKQNLGEKMEQTYNKVQYSEFTPDRVGQWVLRGDTIEEVLDLKAKLFGVAQPVKPVIQAPVVVPQTQNSPFVPQAPKTYNVNSQSGTVYPPTPKQVNAIYKMANHAKIGLDALGKQFGFTTVESIADKKIASNVIDYLMNLK